MTDTIRLVRQLDDDGCIVASLAMVTGCTYLDIKHEIPEFEQREGLNFRHVDDFLHRHGYAWQTIFAHMPPGNTKRDPWPPAPWADVHLAEVEMPSGNYHSVVMLADGRVLDPLTEAPRRLSDYPKVASVRAVYRAMPIIPRRKGIYIGAPACFALEEELRHVCEAFGVHACYIVGSVLECADWRDVDVRLILDDEEFAKVFPDAGDHWEHDARWLLLTVAISERLSKRTGLPVDFQFQPRTHANARHAKARSAAGMRIRG